MRFRWIFASLMLPMASAPAVAQDTVGPLAPVGNPAPRELVAKSHGGKSHGGKSHVGKSHVGKSHVARTADAKPAGERTADKKADAPLAPWAAVDPGRATLSSAAQDAKPVPRLDDNDIEYGMKANGANVSAGQTREQNYNGNVTGIGGELGMKMHF